MNKALIVLLMLAVGHTWAQGVEERLRRAQDLVRESPRLPLGNAQAMLESAATLCDAAADGACAETYAWLGATIQSSHPNDLQVLQEKVAPLYAKAVERAGAQVRPEYLELQARLQQQIGGGEPKQLLDRATGIRRSTVSEMTPPARPGDPPALRPGNDVAPPKLLERVEAQYTDLARLVKQEGTVVLSATIGTDGVPRNVELSRSLGFGLDEQAVFAVQHWKFSPAIKDGKPVPTAAMIEVNFRLR